MAQEQTLVAEKRTKTGTSECRRLRRNGIIPGNLYGHGQDPVMFSIPTVALNSMVQSGTRILDLQINGETEKTMFRELQWDTFGINILHVDLLRIDAQERVTVEVSVELKGISPGVIAGGLLRNAVTSADFVVVKLDGIVGHELWGTEINGTANALDQVFSVAVDADGKPARVPPLALETPLQKLRFEKAALRKKLRKQAEREEELTQQHHQQR
nr:50S ribosomal protein L25 [uncultured Halomonas sp.]